MPPYWTYQTGLSRDCSVAFTRSKSNGASFLRVEHGEAHDIGTDFIQKIAQGDERAGTLGHAHQLAVAHDAHELAELHIELALLLGDGADRRLHALDVAAMVGAPHVDHVAEAATELVVMIGDIVGEVGPAPVRLLERPVDLVAELASHGRASARDPPSRPGFSPFGGSSCP